MGQPQNQAQVQAQFVNSNPTNALPCNAPAIVGDPSTANAQMIFVAGATNPAGTYVVTDLTDGESHSSVQASPISSAALATAIAALAWSAPTVTNPSSGVVQFVKSAHGIFLLISGPNGQTTWASNVPPTNTPETAFNKEVGNGALPTVANPTPSLITSVSFGNC